VTTELSKGKARTTLPRSSDLRVVETVPDPTEGRSTGGRFAAGNRLAQGQRWKASIRKLLGKGATNEQAAALAREAFRIYLANLRAVPNDGPPVRVLAALLGRHTVLAGFFTDRAVELGIETDAGAAALEQATKHGQRAERLTVTMLDVASKLKDARRTPTTSPVARIRAAARLSPAPTSPATSATENASTGQPDVTTHGEGEP
jgi:hypothetical protein